MINSSTSVGIFLKLHFTKFTAGNELPWFYVKEETVNTVHTSLFSKHKTLLYKSYVLGAFVKLRKATISTMSVRLSVQWKNSAPIGRIFTKFHVWGFFENLSRQFKFDENRTRINGTLHETNIHFLSYLAHFFFDEKCCRQKLWRKSKHTFCVQ